MDSGEGMRGCGGLCWLLLVYACEARVVIMQNQYPESNGGGEMLLDHMPGAGGQRTWCRGCSMVGTLGRIAPLWAHLFDRLPN